MRSSKRVLSVAVAIILCLGLALPALAAEDDFDIKDGLLQRYRGHDANVVIPSNVTEIGAEVFSGHSEMTSITIPNSVVKIGKKAFYGCTGLTSVTIPSHVTEIDEGAFFGCKGLTSVTFPSGITTIDRQAFFNCTALTSVTIPSSITEISYGAFWGCTGLTSVTIPASVTSIGDYAFDQCKSLTSIAIPGSVTRLGTAAFCESGLTSVTLSKGLTVIGDSAFMFCPLTSVTIPDSTQTIERCAFMRCELMTAANIPSSVTEIGKSAFDGCDALTIYGAAGSAAERYAAAELPRIPFVAGYAAAAVPMAYASTQVVDLDGVGVTFACYALKDANGNATNYIKLRDLAMYLSGTAAQFQVGWDGTVAITTGTAYTPNGSELSTPYSGNRPYQNSGAATKVNGQTSMISAIVLTDDSGGGYTYYQLRDLGQALGFNVGWSTQRGMFLETNRPYDASN